MKKFKLFMSILWDIIAEPVFSVIIFIFTVSMYISAFFLGRYMVERYPEAMSVVIMVCLAFLIVSFIIMVGLKLSEIYRRFEKEWESRKEKIED